AEGSLREADRHRDGEIVALTAEELVRADPHDHIQVAGRSAVLPGAAPVLQPDPLAVADPRRDPHLDGARPPLDSGPPARAARRLDAHAGTAACAARP